MTMIDQKTLNELLSYDPDTGCLTWKFRDRKWFSRDRDFVSWNAQFAYQPAFTAINGSGYCVGKIFRKTYAAHRLIWIMIHGDDPDRIDHINHKRSDNRIDNLRNISHVLNCRNQILHPSNTTGYAGVTKIKQKSGEKYRASVSLKDNYIHVGNFDTAEEAHQAVLKKRISLGFHANHGMTK